MSPKLPKKPSPAKPRSATAKSAEKKSPSNKPAAESAVKPVAKKPAKKPPAALGRMWFAGNPWPEGHPIETFQWTARAVGKRVHFAFHLETARYYAERTLEDPPTSEGDWLSPGVWGNYHRCILSATQWHAGGFDACALTEYGPEKLDGLRVKVDTIPGDVPEEREHHAFHIYLLGHDAVVNHVIAFARNAIDPSLFDIDWRGDIALAYTGALTPKYKFKAKLVGVAAPQTAK